MELKDLQREAYDAERLSERNRLILQLADQLQAAKGEVTTLGQQLAAKDVEIATMKSSQETTHE